MASPAPVAVPLLEVRHLTRRFGGLTAVDDMSFAIREREILGLIGPNGAGKTTLVSLVSGAQRATAGTIDFAGRPIGGLPSVRRARLGIARTFQVMKPFRGLTVLDNVAVGALYGRDHVADLPAARAAAAHCLALVGLEHRAGQRADDLGGPDRKRLELAKALAARPRLLLLDEVMAGLNHAEIDEVIGIIRGLRERGITLLVIEHVMKAIQSLSDRVVVLHHGELIAEGPPDAVLAAPAVVDAYLGRRSA
jgi:branched-chain amino acid transport system ATP-binding protein